MGTKENPGRFDCFGKALPDEPVFTLLGRDVQAPGIILIWATEREVGIAEGRFPASDMAMVVEARELAHRMLAWRRANDGAWRHANPELPLGAPLCEDEGCPQAGTDHVCITRAEAAEQESDAALGLHGPQNPAPLFCRRNAPEPRLFDPGFVINLHQPRTADTQAVADAQRGPSYPEL